MFALTETIYRELSKPQLPYLLVTPVVTLYQNGGLDFLLFLLQLLLKAVFVTAVEILNDLRSFVQSTLFLI